MGWIAESNWPALLARLGLCHGRPGGVASSDRHQERRLSFRVSITRPARIAWTSTSRRARRTSR